MVCATSFYAPLLKLFTSMKVVDDVNNNISTFYGEILRVKGIVEYTKENKPMLVLIDEIFKGTNTKDRIVGAKATIEKLNRNDIYSIVTTHDPELCQIENVSNFHFLEYYENDEIKFDYKIHDGVSNTRNAIYLLKIAGIIDK
jgi:DNA mismatch repair ATPase MutS